MRISLAISALILLIALSFGLKNHRQLTTARVNQEKLSLQATGLGISLEPTHTTGPLRRKRPERGARNAEAKQIAKDLIALVQKMETKVPKNQSPDEADQEKLFTLMDRMAALDSAQLKILIAEFRANPDLKEEMRQGFATFALLNLTNELPGTALNLFTETADLLPEKGMKEHLVSSALSRLAKDDPVAALDWLRKNIKAFPDLVTEPVKIGLITGTATNDPRLAFALIGELEIPDPRSASQHIVRAARSPEERTAALIALREYLAAEKNDKLKSSTSSSALFALGSEAMNDGFDKTTQWIASLQPSAEELRELTQGVASKSQLVDKPKVIEWLNRTLPEKESQNQIRTVVSSWTRDDFKAAGEWLVTAPEGPMKNASVRAYAETVSKYDPETAVEWAITLPEGKDRTNTLKQIHNNWPKDDPASTEAAAAFAAEHGIK